MKIYKRGNIYYYAFEGKYISLQNGSELEADSKEFEIIEINDGDIWSCSCKFRKIVCVSISDKIIKSRIIYSLDGNHDLDEIWQNSISYFLSVYKYYGKWGKWCWKCRTSVMRIPSNLGKNLDGLCWSCYGA